MSIKKEVIVCCLLLALITVLFYFIDIDLIFQKPFFKQTSGWYLADEMPWQQIRDYSSIPALLLVLFSVVGIILGFNFRKFAPYRKVFLFFLILMAIGPGLIVNVILKDNFGRPRPRNITQFDGKYEYEKPLIYSAASPGKSFPCGHASMGFYFFGVFILYRRLKRFLAWMGLIFGIFWGGIIGLTRMLQGGHFLSDVLFSGIIIYLSSLIIYKFFKFSQNNKITVIPVSSTKKRIFSALFSLVFVFIVLAVLLATPRSKTHHIRFDNLALDQAEYIDIKLDLLDAEYQIIPADSLLLTWKFQGFGFPKSNLRSKKEINCSEVGCQIFIQQYVRGYFTELQQKINIYIPRGSIVKLSGRIGKKELNYYMNDFENDSEIRN